jgi:hypothetical protein
MACRYLVGGQSLEQVDGCVQEAHEFILRLVVGEAVRIQSRVASTMLGPFVLPWSCQHEALDIDSWTKVFTRMTRHLLGNPSNKSPCSSEYRPRPSAGEYS